MKRLFPVSKRALITSRRYHVLAIESSCDDSSVCLIDRPSDRNSPPILIDHVTRSLDNSAAGGIIPIDAVAHHLSNIAPLVHQVLNRNNLHKVDLVCATKGPGMFSSLASGFNLAKGLSIAWNVPLIGVHHMLGHLLTPRFFTNGREPKFPFLCLLVSGGHTMLVLCKSLLEHEILATTIDVAIGNALDKCARKLGITGQMLGKELEIFVANSDDLVRSSSVVPEGYNFPNPLQNRCGRKDLAAFSFAPFVSVIDRNTESIYGSNFSLTDLSESERKEIGRRVQWAILNHLTTKTKLAVNTRLPAARDIPMDFVCSGGVASNSVLRQMLSDEFKEYNFKFHFPDPKWCADNALMIGWAGIELWECGLWKAANFNELPVAKWPLPEISSINI